MFTGITYSKEDMFIHVAETSLHVVIKNLTMWSYTELRITAGQ